MGSVCVMNSLVVCVEFDDFLAITLPRNRRHFARTLVVTSCSDTSTQHLAKDNGCECLATDVFYEGGAVFNKGAAVEKGLDVLGRDGWFCMWDADIVMPESIEFQASCDSLYSPFRKTIPPGLFRDDLDWALLTNMGPTPGEFPGFFQLFHSTAAGPRPWYSTSWTHAGGYDSDFQKKFGEEQLKRPPFVVLHLGPSVDIGHDMPDRVGENWCGRVTRRIDTGEEVGGSGSRRLQRATIIANRRAVGTVHPDEKITW